MNDKIDQIKVKVIPSNKADITAEKEKTNYKDEIAEDKAKADHQNIKSIKNIISWGAKIAIIVMILVFVSFVLIFSWHLVATENYQWLTNEQMDKLRDMMMAALASGFVTAYGKKILN
jgi:hypothetical protein